MLILLLLLHLQGRPIPARPSGTEFEQGNRIEGKVVDDQNKPVSNIVLHLKNDVTNDPALTAQSFGNGSFHFDGVALGFYVISIADSRYLLKDTHLDLREPQSFARSVVIVVERNDGTVHGLPPQPADLAELDKLDMPKLAASTTPEALDEFSKGVQGVRLAGKQAQMVVAANGKNDDTAEAHFKKAVALDPKFYEATLQLGQEQRRQNHTADSIQTLEHAVTMNATDDRPLRALGGLYVDQKQYQKAVDVLVRAGGLGTLDANDRFHLGLAFENLDNAGAAQQQFATSISLMPGRNPQAYLHLHNAYVKMNRLTDAEKTLEDFVRLFPNDPNRKSAEERMKKLRDAIKKQPK